MVIFWPLKSTYLILTLEDSGIDKEREREREREIERARKRGRERPHRGRKCYTIKGPSFTEESTTYVPEVSYMNIHWRSLSKCHSFQGLNMY